MSENLLVGLELFTIGMGFVLSFLCVLIVSMICMSKIVGYLNKIFPEKVAELAPVKVQNDDEAIAIALAVIASKRV